VDVRSPAAADAVAPLRVVKCVAVVVVMLPVVVVLLSMSVVCATAVVTANKTTVASSRKVAEVFMSQSEVVGPPMSEVELTCSSV